METKEITCINCPLGCQITVVLNNKEIVQITGNTCKRGENYARSEVTNPRRIVTSTILVQNGKSPLVPCKTQSDIPKEMIFDCMEVIRKAKVTAPIKVGDVLIHDVVGTGVDVVATKTIL